MKSKGKYRKKYRNVVNFFPLHLLLDFITYNRLILLSWLFPFLFITSNLGQKFGIPSLFLTPEYEGNVNIAAFLFSGMATGSFIMAFHISSYIVMAHRHPFIVRFSKPFYVYSLNNSIIPIIYLITFMVKSYIYQRNYEFLPLGNIIANLLFFLIGTAFFIYLSFGFFYFVVKLVPSFYKKIRKRLNLNKKGILSILNSIIEKDASNKIKESPLKEEDGSKVSYYFTSVLKIRRIGKYSHYPTNKFRKVFQYQHINAFLYVVFVLAIVILRGLLKDVPSLIIPAGASFMIFFTVLLLTASLFYIIFRKWTVVAFIGLLILFGYFVPQSMFKYYQSAYGMDYSINKNIDVFSHGDFKQDSLNTIKILNNWKAKNTISGLKNIKPKMVIICASGGGLKMSVWTYYALGYTDSVLNGNLLRHTSFISGASGGILGAAYLRENYLRYINGKEKETYSLSKTNLLSKDILNPVFYSFSMSDWFFRLQSFNYKGHRYYKDRAYIFEQTINRNLNNVLDKPLGAYRQPVQKALIPMMVLSPSIENVGSRLYISSVGISYLTKSSENINLKSLELRHNFAAFNPDSLRYLTAIRMNATFPYVCPDVQMPGEPRLFIMDAGLNDNFGLISAYLFISEFKEWIDANTSGVILISLYEKSKADYHFISNPVWSTLRPLGSIFGDYNNIQEINYFSIVPSLRKMLPGKFKMINIAFGGTDKKVPLSWHLSKYDKQILFNSIHSTENQKNIEYLKKVLN